VEHESENDPAATALVFDLPGKIHLPLKRRLQRDDDKDFFK